MNKMEEYLEMLDREERSESTKAQYRRNLNRFLRYTNGRTLDKQTVIAYKEELKKSHTPGTVNGALAAINGYLRFLGLWELRAEYARARRITSGPVFITKKGTTMDRSNIWRSFRALCPEAGVDPRKVYPHNLRHLFARCFYEEERDLAKLADVLGHSSVNTTRIYISSSGREHQERVDRLGLTE